MADRKSNEVSGRWIAAYKSGSEEVTKLPAGEIKKVYDTSKSDAFFDYSNLQTTSVPSLVYSG